MDLGALAKSRDSLYLIPSIYTVCG